MAFWEVGTGSKGYDRGTVKNWTLRDVAAHWDHSPNYDAQNAAIDSYMRRFRDSAPLCAFPKNARVLDCDCRTGNGTVFFSERYPDARFTCVAMAPTFKTRAEANFAKHGIQAPVTVMTACRLPFDDASFDVVLSYETLEHVPWPTEYIEELGRLLTGNGTLVLTTPNTLWEPVHALSAFLKFDHGEGPHRMVPRREILAAFAHAGLEVVTEKTFVLVPAGPNWLLVIGYWLEKMLPKWFLRMIALRRTFVCKKSTDLWWHKLKADVIDTHLDTACGTAVGISDGTLAYQEQNGALSIVRTSNPAPVPRAVYDACPARFCDYPALNRFVFGKEPQSWLTGTVEQAYIGHASDEALRRAGASGGVITQALIHLLEKGCIRGAVCLRMGNTDPWKAEPVVARTREEILACAQSVYSETPVNTILATLAQEEGPLAYVGLPDQVAGIRKLQQMEHPSVRHIKYVLGPYTGTQMTCEAIRSFLRSNGVRSEREITELRYRAGEWPGKLKITLKNGRVLSADKFHYNYLIPFFITRGCRQIPDFMNELTDISVGDAWSPRYEKQGGGFSVVLARSAQGKDLLESMRSAGLLTLNEIPTDEVLAMHGHMLDFKKRGSFIRNSWKGVAPEYGYRPAHIPLPRIMIEWCLWFFFTAGSTRVMRWTVEHLPLCVIGPVFTILRKSWKAASKPTKRRGLREMKFVTDDA